MFILLIYRDEYAPVPTKRINSNRLLSDLAVASLKKRETSQNQSKTCKFFVFKIYLTSSSTNFEETWWYNLFLLAK